MSEEAIGCGGGICVARALGEGGGRVDEPAASGARSETCHVLGWLRTGRQGPARSPAPRQSEQAARNRRPL